MDEFGIILFLVLLFIVLPIIGWAVLLGRIGEVSKRRLSMEALLERGGGCACYATFGRASGRSLTDGQDEGRDRNTRIYKRSTSSSATGDHDFRRACTPASRAL